MPNIYLLELQDLWNHKELLSADCSRNGEVLSIVCFKDKIFSGHSDGTIKVSQSVSRVNGTIEDCGLSASMYDWEIGSMEKF